MSEKNVDEMYRELMVLLGKVENPFLKQLIQKYFGDEKFERLLKTIPLPRRCITALWEDCWSIR